MSLLKVTVTLRPKSGIDADNVMNVWHFMDSAGPMIDGTLAMFFNGFAIDFYNPLGRHLGPSISRSTGVHTMEGRYRQASGSWGEPRSFNFTTQSPTIGETAGLPAEVASCLSFSGDLTGVAEESGLTRPASRKRGRIYIGPLTQNWLEEEAETGRIFASSDVRTEVVTLYNACKANWDAMGPEFHHCVFSPTTAALTFPDGGDFATFPVRKVWMDDAFDIIRSRGQAPTSRVGNDVGL